eukprot:4501480-Pyramimonas_sp.AAC.1
MRNLNVWGGGHPHHSPPAHPPHFFPLLCLITPTPTSYSISYSNSSSCYSSSCSYSSPSYPHHPTHHPTHAPSSPTPPTPTRHHRTIDVCTIFQCATISAYCEQTYIHVHKCARSPCER